MKGSWISIVMAGKFGGTLKGFTGVGMGGYGSPGYFNAKADRNIDIMRSVHTPSSTNRDEKWLQHGYAKCIPIQCLNTYQ